MNVRALPVTIHHTSAVEALELLHRDPFDRLLIIQARHEGLRLLTVDDEVLAYGSPTMGVRSKQAHCRLDQAPADFLTNLAN